MKDWADRGNGGKISWILSVREAKSLLGVWGCFGSYSPFALSELARRDGCSQKLPKLSIRRTGLADAKRVKNVSAGDDLGRNGRYRHGSSRKSE